MMKQRAMGRVSGRLTGCLLLACLATACTAGAGTGAEPSALERAGAEATAIIEKAQATALVLQAQAVATSLVQQAAQPLAATQVAAATVASTSSAPVRATSTPLSTIRSTPTARAVASVTQTVEVTGVGFAMEGGFINIRFKAPYEVSEHWWQGSVSIVDEASGVVYEEIPVMPKLGPLMSKPKIAGQTGYIMLVNGPVRLKPGALVTAVLGNYRFEHLRVE